MTDFDLEINHISFIDGLSEEEQIILRRRRY